MSTQINEKQNRREFLRDFARYLTLGGLVFIGALFIKRKASSTEEECINLGVCRSCSVFKKCGLPLALLTRKTIAR